MFFLGAKMIKIFSLLSQITLYSRGLHIFRFYECSESYLFQKQFCFFFGGFFLIENCLWPIQNSNENVSHLKESHALMSPVFGEKEKNCQNWLFWEWKVPNYWSQYFGHWHIALYFKFDYKTKQCLQNKFPCNSFI